MAVPVVLQSDYSECGVACLAMVLGSFGHIIDMPTLRRKADISSKGVALQTIMEIAEEFSLVSDAYSLSVSDLNQLPTASILHWNKNHFVVYVGKSKSKITIHDPAIGKVTLTYKEFEAAFSGTALCFKKNKGFAKGNFKKKIDLKSLFGANKGFYLTFVSLFLLALLSQAGTAIIPVVTQLIIDDIIVEQKNGLATLIFAVAFGVVVLNTLNSYLNSVLSLLFSSKLSHFMSSEVFKKLLSLPVTFFEKKGVGDIASRFDSTGHIQFILLGVTTSGLINLIMIFISGLLLLKYSPIIFFSTLAGVLFVATVKFISYPKERELTEYTFANDAVSTSEFIESARCFQMIKIFEIEEQRFCSWKLKYKNKIQSQINLAFFQEKIGSFTELTYGALYLLILFVCINGIEQGTMTIGQMFAVTSFQMFFTQSSRSVVEDYFKFKMIELHITRLSEILLTPSDEKSRGLIASDSPKQQSGASILLSNASFKYGRGEPYVFENVSLSIGAGESVALVGVSGAGKTTLIKCMLGLIKLNKGSVLINGTDVNKTDGLNVKTAAVMQDDALLRGSLCYNITLKNESELSESDWKMMEDCAKNAYIDHVINELPMGYLTNIGEMGNVLSGGQQQRVHLARALYSRPDVLFLDEATSHLDSEAENMVNNSIKELGITRVVVAHRQSTIDSCERIIHVNV